MAIRFENYNLTPSVQGDYIVGLSQLHLFKGLHSPAWVLMRSNRLISLAPSPCLSIFMLLLCLCPSCLLHLSLCLCLDPLSALSLSVSVSCSLSPSRVPHLFQTAYCKLRWKPVSRHQWFLPLQATGGLRFSHTSIISQVLHPQCYFLFGY